MKAPIRVAVTGGAGQMATAAFRLANGEAFGRTGEVILQIANPPGSRCARSVVMELEDCAYRC